MKKKKPRRSVVDCDPGIDDALALLLAFASDDIEIKAITTAAGNVGVDQTTRNLLKILSLVYRNKSLRIGKGSSSPLNGRPLDARSVHGNDGLGEAVLPVFEANRSIEEATELIKEAFPGHCDTLIATAPLTNIARAISCGADLSGRIGAAFIMGGAFREKGNVSAYAEFNFLSDPEAAKIVLTSGLPITLVSLDVTHKVILGEAHLSRISGKNKRLIDFIKHIVRFSIDFHKRSRGIDGTYMHDPLAVAIAIDESIAGYEYLQMDVDTEKYRGRLIESPGGGNIRFVNKVDSERFFDIFIDNLNKLCRE